MPGHRARRHRPATTSTNRRFRSAARRGRGSRSRFACSLAVSEPNAMRGAARFAMSTACATSAWWIWRTIASVRVGSIDGEHQVDPRVVRQAGRSRPAYAATSGDVPPVNGAGAAVATGSASALASELASWTKTKRLRVEQDVRQVVVAVGVHRQVGELLLQAALEDPHVDGPVGVRLDADAQPDRIDAVGRQEREAGSAAVPGRRPRHGDRCLGREGVGALLRARRRRSPGSIAMT